MAADQPLTWEDHQAWEADWWGDCANTFGEQAKQLTYAHRMGLVNEPRAGRWPVYDLGDRSVLDFGGGPCSILLACEGTGPRGVVDPCVYPRWVMDRYQMHGIGLMTAKAEQYTGVNAGGWDEVWIYNVLQHTDDPELIVANARHAAKTVRIFEWIDTDIAPGHPHAFTTDWFFDAFGIGVIGFYKLDGPGLGVARRAANPGESFATENFTGENGLFGRAFYGVFPQFHAATECEHVWVNEGLAGDQGDGIDHPLTVTGAFCAVCHARRP